MRTERGHTGARNLRAVLLQEGAAHAPVEQPLPALRCAEAACSMTAGACLSRHPPRRIQRHIFRADEQRAAAYLCSGLVHELRRGP